LPTPLSIDEELELARRQGVRHPAQLPFLLEPAMVRQGAVLLVHGFSAGPAEMKLFGQALAATGFTVLAVRLPGHGTSPGDLATRRWEEWLEAVIDGYRLLAERHERIYGLGMSTGALLLLALSARKELAGMALLSPYLRLRHPLAPLVGMLRFVKKYQRNPNAEGMEGLYYQNRPLQGIFELRQLTRRVEGMLPDITAPALVVGAEGDETTDIESGLEIFRRLGSRRKEYHRYGPEVPHVLCTEENPRWREVLELTSAFIGSLEPREPAG
jgi:carboxylesterase